MATIIPRPAIGAPPPPRPFSTQPAPQPATFAQARATGMPPPLASPMGVRTAGPGPLQQPPSPTPGSTPQPTAPPPASAPPRLAPPPGVPLPNPADATSGMPAPPGFSSWADYQADRRAKELASQKAAYDAWIAQGNTPPAGAVMPGDPRLYAGGGPNGTSVGYYQPNLGGNPAPYWLPRDLHFMTPAELAADQAQTAAKREAGLASNPWVQELLSRHLMANQDDYSQGYNALIRAMIDPTFYQTARPDVQANAR